MRPDETHGLGYEQVDTDPNTAVLLATMDATAKWSATVTLRRWERDHLQLAPGQRLLDVGCGLGDAGIALAEDLDDHGELVGVDASSEMIAMERSRAADSECNVRFYLGNATALDEPDDGFDTVRSERTLQWVPDPGTAVTEMAHVTRPAGLVSLIDSDWSTFSIDVGDDDIARRVRSAMSIERIHAAAREGRFNMELTMFGVVARRPARHCWSCSTNPISGEIVIELESIGSVRVLYLRDNENRFNRTSVDAIHAALDEVSNVDGPVALVTVGEGKFFSNGLDLDWMAAEGSGDPEFLDDVHRLLERVLRLDLITVAAINGHAFAGGAMLAAAHDFRIMREDRGYWCLPEVDLGLPLTPVMFATAEAHLPRPVLIDAVLTGRRFSGQDALAAGIVHETRAEDQLLERAVEIAAGNADKDRAVIRAHKLLLHGPSTLEPRP